jgi:hypothetical protein
MNGLDPGDVPVYRSHAEREEAYRAAERDGTPFLGVDEEPEGYPLTYDLLPAGRRLTDEAHERLQAVVREELERVLEDHDSPTEELRAGIGEQMGNVHLFADEASAREVAAAMSELLFDEDNWVVDR